MISPGRTVRGVRGTCSDTGAILFGNIVRAYDIGCAATINDASWPISPISAVCAAKTRVRHRYRGGGRRGLIRFQTKARISIGSDPVLFPESGSFHRQKASPFFSLTPYSCRVIYAIMMENRKHKVRCSIVKLFYVPESGRMGDVIPFYEDGVFHPFYLGHGWSSVSTRDHLHFYDAYSTDIRDGTGSIVKVDGVYHMFTASFHRSPITASMPVTRSAPI